MVEFALEVLGSIQAMPILRVSVYLRDLRKGLEVQRQLLYSLQQVSCLGIFLPLHGSL